MLLARLSGPLDQRAVAELDELLAAFIAREGKVNAVFDFSGVSEVVLSAESLKERGTHRALMPEQIRVYVSPRSDLYGLGRMFATYQGMAGNREPVIVRTMEEAHAALGIADPKFEPVG